MPTIFTTPELVYIVTSYLALPSDISSLSRCNKTLYNITIPILYHDIEFSTFKAQSIAKSLRGNPSLSKHCQKLSVTLGSYPNISNRTERSRQAVQKKFLSDIEFIIEQCSAQGNLKRFFWDYNTSGKHPSRIEWFSQALQGWKILPLSNLAFQSLQTIIIRHGNSSLGSIDKLDSELLLHHSFPNVSKLDLSFRVADDQFQASSRLLSAFPNVKVLALHINHRHLPESAPEAVKILPDVDFQRMSAFSLSANTALSPILPHDFIDKQSSLAEFYCSVIPGGQFTAVSSKLKALKVISTALADIQPHTGQAFGSLRILHIHLVHDQLSHTWLTFINELPQLKCIEFTYSDFGMSHSHFIPSFLSAIKKDVVELGFVIEDFDIPISISAFSRRLNAILQWCCPVDSVRAIRLAFRFGTGVGHINEVLQDLPDECRLDGSIPRSLEYVLWENDWGRKLYRVERGSDSVPKIAYSGLERLPGRFSNPNLTWSNDSIIDHMDTSEPRLGDDQLS